MEATREAKSGSLLDKVKPPRLEDAGLEDCALPPDSIREAFLKAATTVSSHMFHHSDDELEGDCINDPLAGITSKVDPLFACDPKKGGELPKAIGDEAVELEVSDEAEKSCVDELQRLKVGDKKG
ncbi:unnamed protein product [Lactuca virosa]|uniref:Uncharacterized protein n=1 Tax=Lactuca virosa TaxID=75947 RepID=A0AAU9MXU1_9ASTR|nr:unnamed protein product [Lactuca virosa]